MIHRSAYIKDEHLEYLTLIIVSGAVDQYKAQPHLARQFPKLGENMARETLIYWINTNRGTIK